MKKERRNSKGIFVLAGKGNQCKAFPLCGTSAFQGGHHYMPRSLQDKGFSQSQVHLAKVGIIC